MFSLPGESCTVISTVSPIPTLVDGTVTPKVAEDAAYAVWLITNAMSTTLSNTVTNALQSNLVLFMCIYGL